MTSSTVWLLSSAFTAESSITTVNNNLILCLRRSCLGVELGAGSWPQRLITASNNASTPAPGHPSPLKVASSTNKVNNSLTASTRPFSSSSSRSSIPSTRLASAATCNNCC
uniref:Uncharacterized protein n=1 Tax=Panstrongylus lignarius TaxID=156445 RepID=A0A224Y0U3_9HEMI